MPQITSPQGINANDILSYYYLRPSPNLLLPMLEDLLPLNGPSTGSYGPMLFFLAEVFRNLDSSLEELVHRLLQPDDPLLRSTVETALHHADTAPARAILEQRQQAGILSASLNDPPHDVLVYGAQGPNSVNCLWAHFFASGDRRALDRMIAALPSWHFLVRQMRSQGQDPAQSVIQGAGHSVHWSLKANAYQHTRARDLCHIEKNRIGLPLAAREELFRLLDPVQARLDRDGLFDREAMALDYLRQFGEGPETLALPLPGEVQSPARESQALAGEPQALADSLPLDEAQRLEGLSGLPFREWADHLLGLYPDLEALEAGVAAQETSLACAGAEAPAALRAAVHRATGLICWQGRFFWLAGHHLARAHELQPTEELGDFLTHIGQQKRQILNI